MLRIIPFVILDAIFFALSVYFAFLLRFSGEIPDAFFKGLGFSCVFIVILKIYLMWIFRLYKVPWKFFGLNEARAILTISLLCATIFYIFFLFFSHFLEPFPRSVIIIDAVLSSFFVGIFRISKRIFLENRKNGQACVIIGSDDRALCLLKSLKSGTYGYYPVGVIADKKQTIAEYCDGFLVEDKNELKNYVLNKVQTAIIAADLGQNELNILYDELVEFGFVDIKIFSLLNDKQDNIVDIKIEDLLARKPKDLDTKIVKGFIESKVVMVTGAGGSIGSEICKQCLEFGCKSLIMIDHSEYNLYSLNETTNHDPRNHLVMLNITNLDELDDIFKKYNPDIVIHAAAYKHVFLCEFNPAAAIKNNIIGTKNVIDLSKKYRVKKVVLISTDKAVRPTSIMGATKRICELYSLNSNEKGVTQIVAVRFGNVLGSSGSVILKFKAQIAANCPLSVTHPDVSRYFMLVSEACALVLQAASIDDGGGGAFRA